MCGANVQAGSSSHTGVAVLKRHQAGGAWSTRRARTGTQRMQLRSRRQASAQLLSGLRKRQLARKHNARCRLVCWR